MIKKINYFLIILLSLVVLVACQSTEEASPSAPALPEDNLPPEQILMLGDVSDDPASTIEDYQPLADYLATHLADYGIKQGQVIIAPDLGTMQDYLKTGEVDIYFESPYGALSVYEETGAIPLARRWKKGVSEYYTVIVVRTDSHISSVEGLQGKVIAFEDAGSTSGYLLPKAHLIGLGYNMTEVQSTNDSVPDDSIGFILAGGDKNVTTWVLSGKTAAGALPISNYEKLSDEDKAQLTVITQTTTLPRHIVMVSPTMDEALREALFNLLIDMDQTPEGQNVLKIFEKTARFDALPLGSEGTMEALKKLFAPVR